MCVCGPAELEAGLRCDILPPHYEQPEEEEEEPEPDAGTPVEPMPLEPGVAQVGTVVDPASVEFSFEALQSQFILVECTPQEPEDGQCAVDVYGPEGSMITHTPFYGPAQTIVQVSASGVHRAVLFTRTAGATLHFSLTVSIEGDGVGGSARTATELLSGQSVEAELIAPGDQDLYFLRTPSFGRHLILLTPEWGLQVSPFGRDGAPLGSYFPGQPLQLELDAGQDLFVLIQSPQWLHYSISSRFDADDHPGTLDRATELPLDGPEAAGEINYEGDQDVFVTSAPINQVVRFDCSPECDLGGLPNPAVVQTEPRISRTVVGAAGPYSIRAVDLGADDYLAWSETPPELAASGTVRIQFDGDQDQLQKTSDSSQAYVLELEPPCTATPHFPPSYSDARYLDGVNSRGTIRYQVAFAAAEVADCGYTLTSVGPDDLPDDGLPTYPLPLDVSLVLETPRDRDAFSVVTGSAARWFTLEGQVEVSVFANGEVRTVRDGYRFAIPAASTATLRVSAVIDTVREPYRIYSSD